MSNYHLKGKKKKTYETYFQNYEIFGSLKYLGLYYEHLWAPLEVGFRGRVPYRTYNF